MPCYPLALSCLLALTFLAEAGEPQRPLALHPDNAHYFLFRGKPTILLTSGEHYGAVLNKDFDHVRYLDELKRCGFNLTRTFSGTYFEVPGSFKIVDNTLAPAPKAYLGPWARSNQPGAVDEGTKFDLTRWDEAYFARLKDFVAQAGKRGIVVELVLFCPLYEDNLWHVSPMRAPNNVNGVGKVGRTEVFALKEEALTQVQEAVIREIVRELRDFDNVYFEVCNEPYFGGVTRAWQDCIIDVIVDAEKDLKHRHLIAQNIANGSAKIEKPSPHVSVFNFHYATPPNAVELNYHLKRPIGDDETGFRGTGDFAYRSEAWEFFLAGGAIYSNLDYSFTCKHPDGTAKVVGKSQGGGGPALRLQLQILREFLDDFDFVHMTASPKLIKAEGPGPPTVYCLAMPGNAYAIYVKGGPKAKLTLDLPIGPNFVAKWIDTRTGKVVGAEALSDSAGAWELTSPEFTEDIALRVVRWQHSKEKLVRVVIQTDMGDIEVELNGSAAPKTTANFLKYVDGKFYDGGRFHRTVTPKNQPDNKIKI